MDTKGSLIGLAGKAGCGKSEVALVLAREGYRRHRFAGPLKAMLTTLLEEAGFGEDEIIECIEGDLKELPVAELSGHSPRHAMVTLGTEWGRDTMHPDFWVNLWKFRVCALLDAGFDVVVEDVRFPNEEQMIRKMGGRLFLVEGRSKGVQSGHPSETHRVSPDEIINNEGTLEDLEKAVLGLL